MKRFGLQLLLFCHWAFTASAAPPVISNVSAAQRAGTKLVDVTYSVADPDSGSLTIQVEISANNGITYDLPTRSLSGKVGPGVPPGQWTLTWDAGRDWNGNWSDACRVRLWAHDGSTPVPPLGMVYIPNGTFLMGADPGVEVTLTRSFFMDRTEVSAELWNSVRNWALSHGYSDPVDSTPRISPGVYRALGHPINSVSWHDCTIWCNARSEMEGLTPCYYSDDAQTLVLRIGSTDLSSARVKWTANGYRLPTEAEWERAARGGLHRKAFPWGDAIQNSNANYYESGDPFEQSSTPLNDGPAGTTPCGYFNGNQVPNGTNMSNGYGLLDMSGNVWEWCWPSAVNGSTSDPIKAEWYFAKSVNGNRVNYNASNKGGGWIDAAATLRLETQSVEYPSFFWTGTFSSGATEARDNGFRSIRGL